MNHILIPGLAPGSTVPTLDRCSYIYTRRPLRRKFMPFYAATSSAEVQRACKNGQVVGKIAAAIAAGWLCTSQPAWAELPTVAPSTVTQLARPLPKQQVQKGRIWLVFLLGATSLFGAAVLLENNATLFPAIHKANQAMAANKQTQQKTEEEEDLIEVEQAQEERFQGAVLDGLAEARAKGGATDPVLAESSKPQDAIAEDQVDDGAHSQSQQQESSQPATTEEREPSIASTSSQRQ